MPYATAIPNFLPGFRLLDGLDVQQFSNLYSAQNGITAFATGGQTNATQLNAGFNNVVTVANANDSVKLPPLFVGAVVMIMNSHASNAIQVFGHNTSTINGIASGTGVSQASGKAALYYAVAPGAWFRLLGA